MSETKYTEDHEWLRAEGDVQRIGITDYAQAQLGDVVYVDLPAVGQTFSAGEAIGEIESTKSVGELIAPADGEVVEANEQVVGDPTLVNSDPEGAGWLVTVRLTGEPQLLDAEAYAGLTA